VEFRGTGQGGCGVMWLVQERVRRVAQRRWLIRVGVSTLSCVLGLHGRAYLCGTFVVVAGCVVWCGVGRGRG